MKEKREGISEMLRWKLRLLMAEKKITNKELANLSGLHPTSISRLKVADEIEQISGKTLESICTGLTLAYQARGDMRLITPGDLFEFTFDNNRDSQSAISLVTAKMEESRQKKTVKGSQRSQKTQKTPKTNKFCINIVAWVQHPCNSLTMKTSAAR